MTGARKITILLIALIGNAFAYETDQYSVLDKQLSDSGTIVNNWVNDTIENALKNKRYHKKSCESVVFRLGLKLVPIESKLSKSKEIDFYPPLSMSNKEFLKQSVYKDVPRIALIKLSRTLRMNDVYFGTDKLSHFMGMGYTYWMKYKSVQKYFIRKYEKEGNWEEKIKERVVRFGYRSEKGLVGFFFSGVFSYGDLEANYQGFELFRKFCEGDNPLLQKKEGKWTLTKRIYLEDYINPLWDETYNQSYLRKRRWSKVRPELKNYCDELAGPIATSRMKLYSEMMASSEPSFSKQYLDQLVSQDKVPDVVKDQDFSNLCK